MPIVIRKIKNLKGHGDTSKRKKTGKTVVKKLA